MPKGSTIFHWTDVTGISQEQMCLVRHSPSPQGSDRPRDRRDTGAGFDIRVRSSDTKFARFHHARHSFATANDPPP